MSRYPFEEFANKFMASMDGVYSEATFVRYTRRYKRMGLDIRNHSEKGLISTTSPKRMTPEDVRVHLKYRKSLGYSDSEYAHEVTTMIVLFDFCENSAVRTCLRKYPLLRPNSKHVRLPSLDPDVYDRIVSRVSDVALSDDYRLIRSYAMLSVFLGCGPRTKELRFINIGDLDTREWILDIVHVKGENTYGFPRSVPVPPEFREILTRYIGLRERYNSSDSEALFPPSRGSTEYLVGNSVRKILSIALDDLGIDTEPRTLRRTFGQHYLDSDIDSIESVSVLMGHSTTQTTETFYARRRNEKAIEEARKTFSVANPSGIDTDGNDSQHDEEMENGAGNGRCDSSFQKSLIFSNSFIFCENSPFECFTVIDSQAMAGGGC